MPTCKKCSVYFDVGYTVNPEYCDECIPDDDLIFKQIVAKLTTFDAINWVKYKKEDGSEEQLQIWQSLSEEERKFMILACQLDARYLFAHWEQGFGFLCRRIFVTKLAACYGNDSAFLIEIEGSPPKGTFLVLQANKELDKHATVFYGGSTGMEKIDPVLYGAEQSVQHLTVINFLKDWMRRQKK